jgi:subtilisin family serine protease
MSHRRALVTVLVVAAAAAVAWPAVSSPAPSPEPGLCDLLGRILRLGCEADAGVQPAADPSSSEPAVRATDAVVRYDPGRLTVSFKPDVSRQRIDATLGRARVTLERAIPQIRAYLVRVPPSRRTAALASLRESPLVASAEREPFVDAFAITPDDEDWPQQWGLRLAGFPDAWTVTRGSSHVVVAVLDTGVDRTQPELRGALVPGYDFVNGDPDPSDDHGHGTPVAGIIGARGNNRTGVAGVCWSCSVMPVKVLDAKGVGLDSVIAAGIVWAVDHGARVINLSLGGPGDTEDLENAIAYAVRRNAVVVAAAGNNGTTELEYPGASPSALSVAGTNSADRRYSWSNYGSWVRVAAPGCNVAPVRGGRNLIFCGTSSATPVVAGLAALAISANPNATSDEVAAAVQRAATRLPGVVQSGRIDAGRTLSLIAPRSPGPARSTAVFRETVDTGTRTRVFSLPIAAGRVTVTLTFGGRQRLVLSLFHGDASRPLAQVQGRSPLRMARTVPDGTIRLAVRGARRASFVLTVSYGWSS